MKQLLLLAFFLCIHFILFSQSPTWQQEANYKISVVLNDSSKTLDGHVAMDYKNNSPDTLQYVWIHLWPNAFKNDRTAFSDQLLENGRTDFYFSDEEKKGYINRLDFKVNGKSVVTLDHPQHQDIIQLVFAQPLLPGARTTIETPFHIKLPYNFSRGGFSGNSIQATQWFPKLVVYDPKGWHPMPYLDQGEFYSDFGRYDVEITVPAGFKVAATGLRTRETEANGHHSFFYSQDKVHDFAWFADKDFIVVHDTMQLGARTIDLFAYYTEKNRDSWKNVVEYMKNAVRTKSDWLGEYPYPVVTVVERTGSNGGMEYPTITLISATTDQSMLEYVVNHEIGHNWFYGILASNERKHPWMDEGMNSYYDLKYLEWKRNNPIQPISVKSNFIKNRLPDDFEEVFLRTIIALEKDQPIETSSEEFTGLNYNIIAYSKTAQWMKLLERQLGEPLFESVMKTYYERYKFRHPYPEDFRKVAEEVSGKDLSGLFSLLLQKGSIEPARGKSLKLTSFFSLKQTDKYHYISILPAAGFNFYDNLMVGALLHNYNLPPSRLQFFAVPLYATGSKLFNGLGRISYSTFPGNKGAKFILSLNGSHFTGDSFVDSTGKKNYQPYTRIVPALKYVFANKHPRSSMNKYIQWKTFLFNETGLRFTRDTVRQVDVITYPVNKRYVNQLEAGIGNNRVLYPYRAVLQAEQGDGFVRTNLTGNYYFNFPKGGGLNLRFFAGKFFYTGDQSYLKQFETDIYHLNMSGPKGYEDYTYSNYFVGRNEFEKFSSQQIMIRDGGFKVRTDLLSNKIGRTDDWLTAINITTDIPDNINPLKVLPVKLPLKIFVDIGTYAEAWKKDPPTGHFLYDAGLQISLFRNVLNIYIPVFYSKEYKTYFESTITEKRFWKNLSFSIDIQNISINKLIPNSPF